MKIFSNLFGAGNHKVKHLKYSNDDEYQGDMVMDRREGFGIYKFTNGNKYEGQWHNHMKHGEGKFYYHNGELYIGEWHENRKHGQGMYFYNTGDRYVGQWRFNEKDGKGTFYYADGSIYTGILMKYIDQKGYFQKNNKHGSGFKYHSREKKYYQTEYDQDKLVEEIERKEPPPELKKIMNSNTVLKRYAHTKTVEINTLNQTQSENLEQEQKEVKIQDNSEQQQRSPTFQEEEEEMNKQKVPQSQEEEFNIPQAHTSDSEDKKREIHSLEEPFYSNAQNQQMGFQTLQVIEHMDQIKQMLGNTQSYLWIFFYLVKIVQDWSIDDVCKWLEKQDLTEYIESFRNNQVNGQTLLTLTDNELKEDLSVSVLGHRKTILQQIELQKHYYKRFLQNKYKHKIQDKLNQNSINNQNSMNSYQSYDHQRYVHIINYMEEIAEEEKENTLLSHQSENSFHEGKIEPHNSSQNSNERKDDHQNNSQNSSGSSNKSNGSAKKKKHRKKSPRSSSEDKKKGKRLSGSSNSSGHKRNKISDALLLKKKSSKLGEKKKKFKKQLTQSPEIKPKQGDISQIEEIEQPPQEVQQQILTEEIVQQQIIGQEQQQQAVEEQKIPVQEEQNPQQLEVLSISEDSDVSSGSQASSSSSNSDSSNQAQNQNQNQREKSKKMRKFMNMLEEFGINEKVLINYNELETKNKIGEGGYGEVYLGKWLGQQVAIKVYGRRRRHSGKLRYKLQIADFLKEVEVISNLRHPNIVLYMGVCHRNFNYFLITEYLEQGSLFDHLHRKQSKFDEKRILQIVEDISLGMNYLHGRNVMHCDLKSSNVLIDQSWNVKLCDFGLSRMKKKMEIKKLGRRIGTPHWMAPEIMRGESYNERADIYSFGMILWQRLIIFKLLKNNWELATGQIPYEGLSQMQIIGLVGYGDEQVKIPENGNPLLVKLMKMCLNKDSSKRPNFNKVVKVIQKSKRGTEILKKKVIKQMLEFFD